MAEAAVPFVAERLGDLVIEKASSLARVGEKVQSLQKELQWMQSFLKDADAWQQRDERIRNLVAEIRDLAFDAEDFIESYAFRAESRGLIMALSRILESAQVGKKIDDFTSKITELGRKLQTYGIRDLSHVTDGGNQNLHRRSRSSYSHVAEQNVMGLEGDIEKIATQLIDGAQSLAVSICGMGGIGKTTLAKKVFQNTRVRSHFSCFAWAYISQQWKTTGIWEGILIHLTSSSGRKRRRIDGLKNDEIAMELYQLQKKKKCLIVLDDIWTKDAWDCLCAAFLEGNTESKILLTTRNKNVALHVNPDCLIHWPRCLTEPQRFTFNEDFKELGGRIVDRCGGLPMAIKALGGILRTKSTLHDWTVVYDNLVSYLSGEDDGITEFGLTSLLAMSYYDLPYQLKQCFLHFSQFPEDFIIPAKTLINIWVAEGVIQKGSRGEETIIVEVEDIAYTYLEELASRCMIQVEKWGSTGRIRTCSIHDLMRDMCIQEAKKENFLDAKYLKDGNDHEASSSSTIIQSTSAGKIRRLALFLGSSREDISLNYERYAHIRSLLGFSLTGQFLFIECSQLDIMARHFKYLRLLYLLEISVCITLPEAIGDLVHLRLLDVGITCTLLLPSSLGKLAQLLTLKLDRVHVNIKAARVFSSNIFENMHQLRHLYLPLDIFFDSNILNLNHLTNLQTLVNLPGRYFNMKDLVRLPHLRKLKLTVWGSHEYKSIVDQMLNSSPTLTFNRLQSLSLSFGCDGGGVIEITKVAARCPHLHKLKLSGPLVLDLSEGSQIFRNLNRLTIKYSDLVEDPMPQLGKLPNLMVLRLHSALGRDAIMCPQNSFPCLQSLLLSHEEQLKEWTVQEGALPRLRYLTLYYCVNLKTVPKGLRFLNALEELRVGDMPLEFTERIKSGGEDFHEVENVRSILSSDELSDSWRC